MRGISEAEVPAVVDAVVQAVGLGDFIKEQIEDYRSSSLASKKKCFSTAAKRRLSLGMALTGLPPVLLLDEPTSGVDSDACRAIWKALSKVSRPFEERSPFEAREANVAMMLSSHRMDESEMLCSSLAILVHGRFRCIGSIQHLKSRYGNRLLLFSFRELLRIFPGDPH